MVRCVLRGEDSSKTFTHPIDAAVERIVRQVKRYREPGFKSHRERLPARSVSELGQQVWRPAEPIQEAFHGASPKIVREENHRSRECSIRTTRSCRWNLMNPVLVFTNATESSKVNVMYSSARRSVRLIESRRSRPGHPKL